MPQEYDASKKALFNPHAVKWSLISQKQLMQHSTGIKQGTWYTQMF